MMYFNQKIYKLITGKELANDASTEENGQTETGFQDEDGESDAESGGVESPPRETSVRSMVSAATCSVAGAAAAAFGVVIGGLTAERRAL